MHLSFKVQSDSMIIEDLKIIHINLFTLLAPRGEGVKILNLLLQMSYNIPKMLSSEFQTCNIKIEDFNPISHGMHFSNFFQ